jgi:hypothetical protein
MILIGCGGEPVVTSLDAAPAAETFANSTRMEITDGEIDVSSLKAWISLCKDQKRPMPRSKGQALCRDHHFFVAPVRAPGDGPDDEVKAWVDCPSADIETAEACIAHLEGKKPVGRVLWRYTEDTSGWYKAVRDSGLKSAPKAPLILVE